MVVMEIGLNFCTFIIHLWITAISFVPSTFFSATSANIDSNKVHQYICY